MPIVLEPVAVSASLPARDTLRLVQFVAPYFEAARPVLLADLLAGETAISEGGTPALVPGEHETGNIVYDSPYAGEFATLDRHRNSRLTVGLRVRAPDPVVEVDRIVAACLSAPARSAVEWRRGGIGPPTFFPLRGDVNWTPAESIRERKQGGGLSVQLGLEVAPWVHRGSMDVADDFSQDSIGDYTLLSGTGIAVSGGALRPTDTSTKWIAHTGRGYLHGDVQVTSEIVYGTAVAFHEGPPALKILNANNAIWATYDSGYLNVWKTDNGTNVFLAQVSALAPSAGSRRWLRLRIEGNVLTAEWWTAAPTPMGAPTNTVPYTLAGADAVKFGAGVQGKAGIWYWNPHSSLTSYVDSLEVLPYTYRSRTLPDKLTLNGPIPGPLPALCDLEVTHSGGAVAPIYALAGWAPRKAPLASTYVPLGVLEQQGSPRPGFTNPLNHFGAATSDGLSVSVTTSAAGSASTSWPVDGAAIAQPGAETVDVEVYARVGLSATMTGLTLVVSSTPYYGTDFGAERFSDRGRAGLLPIMPSSGFAWRPVRLGRMTLPADRARLALAATWTGAASSDLAVDHLFLVPAKGHVSSPRSLAPDVSYPKWFPSTGQITRTARFDGTGLISVPPEAPVAEHGLGGRIEVGPGDSDLVIWLASMIPGDPTAGTASVQLSHTATVHPVLLPRYHY